MTRICRRSPRSPRLSVRGRTTVLGRRAGYDIAGGDRNRDGAETTPARGAGGGLVIGMAMFRKWPIHDLVGPLNLALPQSCEDQG